MSQSQPVVVDASALAEFLLGTDLGNKVAIGLVDASDIHAPHLLVTEVASVIRSWVLGGHLDEPRAEAALADLADLPMVLWDERPLLPAMWRWRHNLSAYDATYAALAETLRAPLVTTDGRMASALAGSALQVRHLSVA